MVKKRLRPGTDVGYVSDEVRRVSECDIYGRGLCLWPVCGMAVRQSRRDPTVAVFTCVTPEYESFV